MSKNTAKTVIILFILSLSLALPSNAITQSEQRYIDVLLLIDGSGSMSWPDRDPEGLRIQGAKLFIDLCDLGDRVGVVDFSTESKLIFPLYKIATSQDRLSLKSRVDEIEAKGEFTDITLALQTALREMRRARSECVKAIVLLTDGEMDPNPNRDIFSPYNQDYTNELGNATGNPNKIAEIKQKYKGIVVPISREILRDSVFTNWKQVSIPVFTVAFGRGADVPLLREIADFTATETGIRNYYFVERPEELQPVFSEILEQLKKTRERIVEEPVKYTGTEIVHKINIDEFIKEVTFKFIFSRKVTPSEVQIFLKDPSGKIIDKMVTTTGAQHISEEGYELYSIINPLPGTWEAIIKGREDVKLDITVSTWGRTELRILSGASKTEYSVGDSIPITASLFNQGKQITSPDFLKSLEFDSRIENPERQVEELKLFDDGLHADSSESDGIYGNVFTNTLVPGDYLIKLKARGVTIGARGFNFTREAEYKIHVNEKKKIPDTAQVAQSKGPSEQVSNGRKIDWGRILMIALAIFVVIVIIAVIKAKRKKPEGTAPPTVEKIEEGEGIEQPPPPLLPTITEKIKEGKSAIIGSKLQDSSVGEKNLIINRVSDQFLIHAEEGSLELNGKLVAKEKEVKEGDVVRVGNLYFEVQLRPQEDKITLMGITKEQAALKTEEES
jgi:hypothetical protein